MQINKRDALIIVDLQNDFIDGSLAVPGAEAIIEPILDLAEKFKAAGATVVATKDWHPEDHCSFKDNGGLWPAHCVQGTEGAELCSTYNWPHIDGIIHKGVSQGADSYSGFKDDNGVRTGLRGFLDERFVERVFVVGLALDYCVKATAIDAVQDRFEVVVVSDLTAGVKAMTSAKAVNEMIERGVRFAELDEVLA